MKKVHYKYSSIFAPEIISYLKLRETTGKYIAKTESVLKDFDCFLHNCKHQTKALSEDVFISWQKTRQVSSATKCQDCSHMKMFCSYLTSIGIETHYIERPKMKSNYVPYIFSDEEIKEIFYAADNCQIQRRLSRASTIFPFLLRILYGCGLRLGEGLKLKWTDIDLNAGVIYIKNAKNGKSRIVPMKPTLTKILIEYKNLVKINNICENYLFESPKKDNSPMKNNTFYMWFSNILYSANISYAKNTQYERGPCGHCLRHTFTKNSFLQLVENERFENVAPFLEEYLGHNSILETQAYLRSSYTIYEQSHKRIEDAIGNLFPEVFFDEN